MMNITASIILKASDDEVALETAGGKGLNLVRLADTDHPVPPFYIINTTAYEQFVSANKLGKKISEKLDALQDPDLAVLESVAEDIRIMFSTGKIPQSIEEQVTRAYSEMGETAVAVRSSATTEDLPELSFAGQQDTYLNVIGKDSLLDAVIGCWNSLWTARAIGYRMRNGISNTDVSLAVVVQSMVPSEVSGVLFTANPVSGLRTETVIEATFGLGEALVSGKVEPDSYVVDVAKGQIKSKTRGKKGLRIENKPGGGTLEFKRDSHDEQALRDEKILELAQIGSQIAQEYDSPQDIEWALAGDNLYIMQSRPITSLYPLPEDIDIEPMKVMFSLASVQGLFEPMTPLGQDAIKMLFAGGGKLFGYELDHESQTAILSAGERLWVNITSLLRNRIGRKVVNKAIGLIEPGVHQVLQDLQREPGMKLGLGIMRPARLLYLQRVARMVLDGILKNWKDPDQRSEDIKEKTDAMLLEMFAETEVEDDMYARLNNGVVHFQNLYEAFPAAASFLLPAVVSGLLPLNLLNRFTSNQTNNEGEKYDQQHKLGWKLTRGMPNNVTTEMDLYLWEIAKQIKNDAVSNSMFGEVSAQELGVKYIEGALPSLAQKSVEDFMSRFGMRGIGEFDLGRPRWRETPDHVFEVLQGYMSIKGEQQAPDAVFERGALEAESSLDDYCNTMRNTLLGEHKERIVRWLAKRMRTFAGFREYPKFHIIRIMGYIRESLLQSGEELAAAGVLEKSDDLFYLNINEIKTMADKEQRDWKGLVAERRQAQDREERRNQIPRVLVSDGRKYYEGAHADSDDGEDVMHGTAVSPGMVEGVVRVVFDPVSAQLAPGEILVCPGTDPAWTPLFLTAGGLVMEMGGMMTHGSVVARELGIPAVVGVNKATSRLMNGQRIRVDGSTGQVMLIDPN